MPRTVPRRLGRRLAVALVLLAGIAGAGCSLAPRQTVPPAPDVAAWKETGEWAPARPQPAAAGEPWWAAFADPQLDELERQLLGGNTDLAAAVARYREAQAIAFQSRSAVFPQVDAQASANRGKSSANAPLPTALHSTPRTGNDFIAGFQLAWEVDLFGRLRNLAAQSRAEAEAAAADLSAVRLSLEAELASDYFSLRGADTQVGLLERAVRDYDRAWQLTRNRYQEGTAAEVDVDQADTQRQNARAQLAGLRRDRAQLEHAIAVLTGRVASTFSIESAELRADPPPVDPGMPSQLLERRPDVAQAERLMASANAGIGVARAAWFPVVSLGAALGFESITAANWLQAPRRYWSVGPSGRLPLLDAGGRIAINREARARWDEALASYRRATLGAFQEVEDQLAALHWLGEERAADQAAAVSAERAAWHADRRYDAGVADYLEVTSTHTAALSARRAAISAQVAQLDAAVALVRATGGGWNRLQLQERSAP